MTKVAPPEPSDALFIQWIPEFSAPDAIFRIERERQGLWVKLKQLLPDNPWICSEGVRLVFERAVHNLENYNAEKKAKEIGFQFVHFDSYQEESVASALAEEVQAADGSKMKRATLIADWIATVYGEATKVSGSRHSTLVRNLQNPTAEIRGLFFDLLRVLSETQFCGYLSQLSAQVFFCEEDSPIGLFGTIQGGTLSTTLYKIKDTLENDNIPSISEKNQSLASFNGAPPTKNADTIFASHLTSIIHSHSKLKKNATESLHSTKSSATQHGVVILPVFSINPRIIKGTATEPLGAFSGFLYFLAPLHDDNEIQLMQALAPLLRTVFPLLDDFAADLRSGEAEEAIEMRYRSDHVATPPMEFLRQNLHTFSGWRVLAVSKVSANGAFQWNGKNLNVTLTGNDGIQNAELVELKPSPTTSIPKEDEKMARERLGYHVATHLQQIYRELCYIHNIGKVEQLEKFRQMLESLSVPLNGITTALADLQRDTQEIRAVLYDPAKALFECHPRIKDLFEPGQIIHISRHIVIEASHSPTSYSVEGDWTADQRGEGKKSIQTGIMLLWLVVCRAFGVDNELQDAVSFFGLRDKVKMALDRVVNNSSFTDLWDDTCWLIGLNTATAPKTLGERIKMADGLLTIADNVGEAEIFVQTALGHIKAALFTPYKIDAREWSALPLALAVKPYLSELNGNAFSGLKDVFGWKQSKDMTGLSPVNFASALDFVIGICLSRLERKVTNVSFQAEDTSLEISLRFTTGFFEKDDAGNSRGEFQKKAIHDLLTPILEGLKDWRLVAANVGDWQGPFIEFANRALGVVSAASMRDKKAGWIIDADAVDAILALKKVVKNGSGETVHAKFSVVLMDGDSDNGELKLTWSKS